MYGAANFSNLGPMVSVPVALVMSIFFRYFSTFACPKEGIEKLAFSASFKILELVLELFLIFFAGEGQGHQNLINSFPLPAMYRSM